MKKTFFLICCLFMGLVVAQNNQAAAIEVSVDEAAEVYAMSAFTKEVGGLAKIFVDSTNIRKNPSLNSEVVAILRENKTVKIIKETDVITAIQERSAKWYEIEFDGCKGFVWAANLAIKEINIKDKSLLFGLCGTKSKQVNGSTISYLMAEVKLFKDQQLVAKHIFDAGTAENASGVFLENEEALRLNNVQAIISAGVSGEACGIPSIYQYYFLTENSLIPLPRITSVSDAAIFYDSENYFFPQKGNKMTNQFVMQAEQASYIDTDAKILKKNGSTTTKVFTWNGAEYKEISSTKKTFKNKAEETN